MTSSDTSDATDITSKYETLLDACFHGKPLLIAACLIELTVDQSSRLLQKSHLYDNGEVVTPFLQAVRNGHVGAAKLLLKMFAVDPNHPDHRGVVDFDGYLVQGATALWIAAAISHLEMVELLIEYGANVNACTTSSSSPLRAACFSGNIEIVKYLIANGADVSITNNYSNSCLMVSAYRGKLEVMSYLLLKGADPDGQAECGGTALHYAVDGGQLEAVKILCEHGCSINLSNSDGMTAPMNAADTGKATMVEYFTSLAGVSLHDKIKWLELLGAFFANDKDYNNTESTYSYLYLATLYRTQGNIKKVPNPPIPAYNNQTECTTRDQLYAIKDDVDALNMEALIVRERILGLRNPELTHPIVYRGAVYADTLQFTRGILLWQHALDIKQKNGRLANNDLFRFAEVFSQMLLLREEINIPMLERVLRSCFKEILSAKSRLEQAKHKRKKQKAVKSLTSDPSLSVAQAQLDGVVHAMLYLLYVAMQTAKEDNDKRVFEKITYDFLKLDLRDNEGRTPLHLVVDETTPVDEFYVKDVIFFPNAVLTKLLLQCGANPNATSHDGNTALHIIVQYDKPISDFMTLHTVITQLLSYGAHPDYRNKRRQAPHDIATTGVAEIILKSESKRTLKCLAATAVRKYNLKYKGDIPESLISFVEMH